MAKKNAERILRVMILVIADIIIVGAVSFLALWVRFDFRYSMIETKYLHNALTFLPVQTVLTLTVFLLFRLYSSLWRYAGVTEAWNIIMANILLAAAQILGYNIMGLEIPRSFFIIQPIAQTVLTAGVRFSYRAVRAFKNRFPINSEEDNIMIVGGGAAGQVIIREVKKQDEVKGRIACIIDDDPIKKGRYINGILVAGSRKDIPDAVEKFDVNTIIIAIPSASNKERKQIIEICQKTGCKVKILPGVYQLINGEVGINKLRDVEVEDLLGRDPIKTDFDGIISFIRGKTVLVTGGGGSIGSELCRQIASYNPRQLIIFDIYENNAYDIQLELKRNYPGLDLVTLIGSVRNTHRVDSVFEQYHPDIVFHAAAHKHVPLMEDSPNEAIKNNVFGTLNAARSAGKYGADKFILISTDKAVNPTNVMGATKRICEMIVQSMNHIYTDTTYAAVRFGNVLGSNGSVIPLFKKQIQSGGPVTVTHPDIIRYFMTIPEAVALVLQAGVYAKNGEIFVLDMGEPVRIADMARNLIRLSGFEPDVDIEIKYTGLRPGEKLYEELLMSEEGLKDTDNHMIHIGKPIEFDEEQFYTALDKLKITAYEDG
ncbi:MAG: polysaccharide biosynthesis protein, partial [Huintestinicola sp.]